MSENSSFTPWLIHVNCPKSYKQWGVAQIVLLLILYLNGSIIFALVKIRRLSVSSLLVLHLAIADCLLSVTALPQTFAVLVRSPLASSFMCPMTAFFTRVTHSSSICLLTMLASCRCYSILKPLKYRVYFYKSRVNKLCLGAWFTSIAFSLLPLIGIGKYDIMDGQCWCTLDPMKHPYPWLSIFVLFYIFPSMINTLMFIGTIKVLLSQKPNVSLSETQRVEKRKGFSSERPSMSTRRSKIVSSKIVSENSNLEMETSSETTSKVQMTKFKSLRSTSVEDSRFPETEEPASALNKPQVKDNKQLIEVQAVVHNNIMSARDTVDHENYVSCSGDKKVLDRITPANQELLLKTTIECTRDKLEKTETPNSIDDIVIEKQPFREITPVNQGLLCKTVITNYPEQHLVELSFGDKLEKHEILRNSVDGNAKEKQPSSSMSKQKKKRFKVLIVFLLFMSFLVLCSPFFLVGGYSIINEKPVSSIAFNISMFMHTLNSLVNPFFYGLMNKKIRRHACFTCKGRSD